MRHSRTSKHKQRHDNGRPAPHASLQNGAGTRAADGGQRSLPFVGVRFDSATGSYRAQLRHQQRTLNLGRWPTLSEAALARDRAALYLRLKVRLNLPGASPLLGGLSPTALRALAHRRLDESRAAESAAAKPRAPRSSKPKGRQRRPSKSV